MKITNLGIIAMMVSSLVLFTTVSVEAADLDITDPVGDVATQDFSSNVTGVTYSPHVTVANLDITELTFTKNAGTAILTLEVDNIIEERGSLSDLNFENLNANVVGYSLVLSSLDEIYQITYVNKTCQLVYSDETIVNLTGSEFSTNEGILTVYVPLKSQDEDNFTLEAQVIFLKMDISEDIGNIDPDAVSELYTVLVDIAPNYPMTTDEVTTYVFDSGLVGETIEFNGSISPLSGQPPYKYAWDFGDQSTPSEDTNPTHIYTQAGEYTYTFTVTDNSDDSISVTGTIKIIKEGGASPLSTQMIMFLAVLLIIIVIGVVIIVWIIRR